MKTAKDRIASGPIEATFDVNTFRGVGKSTSESRIEKNFAEANIYKIKKKRIVKIKPASDKFQAITMLS